MLGIIVRTFWLLNFMLVKTSISIPFSCACASSSSVVQRFFPWSYFFFLAIHHRPTRPKDIHLENLENIIALTYMNTCRHARALFLSIIAPLVLAGTNEFGRQFLAKKAAEEGVVRCRLACSTRSSARATARSTR